MKKVVSMITLICMLGTVLAALAVPASAAEVQWYESFTQEGSGTITKKGGMVTLTSGATEVDADMAHLYRNGNTSQINSKMDVEFDLQLHKHNGNQLVVFYTGQCRFYMHFNLDNIWGRGYSSTAQYESYTIPYDIGYELHHYQLITDGNVGDLYIDGYYAGTITGETNANQPGRMQILARTAKSGVASYSFGNLKFNKYTGRKISTGGDTGEYTESTFLAKNWEYMKLPNEDTFYDFDNPEDYKNWVKRATWEVKDGVASSWNTQDLKMLSFYGPFAVEKGQDFTYTTRFRVDQFGEQQGIIPSWPGGSFRGYIYREYVEFETPYGQKRSNEIHFEEDKWYEYTVKVTDGGTKNQLFIDGVPITAVEPVLDNNDHPYNGTTYYFTYPNGSMYSGLSIDWTRVELVHNDIEIADPVSGAEYLEGKKIELEATVAKEKQNKIPSVDYIINGQVVATGYAPDYKAELAGMSAGTYEITAEYGDVVANTKAFRVIPSVLAEVQTSEDAYGNLFANLEFFDRMPQIDHVEYRLDGVSVATSNQAPYYEMSLSALPSMQHTLEAICYNKAGVVVYENAKQFATKAYATAASENYANEVRYNVVGEFGNAEVDFGNGRHRLKMTHTRDGLTYLTNEGEKTYNKGLGDFIVMTDGPFAEVYRNGQMVFTFVMPRTREIVKNFTSNGLTISNEQIIIPEERATYFAMNNITEKQSVYNLGDLPNYHVMDAILDVNDEGRLVVNDEYYRTDLQMENGEVFVWTTKTEMMEPFRKSAGKLADWADENGKVYLRAETAVGMTRLYVNGKWVFSFRSVPTIGEGTLAVEVASGDGFEFVCVGDNKDLYYYEDDFSGDTEFDSLTQWRYTNRTKNNAMSVSVDKTAGYMLLGAAGDTYSFADVAAFGGDIDISADVKVVDGTDGFWFDFNRATNHPYSRAGYNFETGQFEIVDVQPSASATTSVTKEGTFPVGEYVNLGLKVRYLDDGSKKVTLSMNGEEVLTKDDSSYWRGKFGFVMKDGSAYIDNFKYRGDIKVMADVRETFTSVNVDLIDLGGDEYILSNGSNTWHTNDGGKSFEKDSTVTTMGDNTVTLQNGDVLGVKSELQYVGEDGKLYYNFIPYISHDKGKTWDRHGSDKMSEKDAVGLMYNAMQNRIKQGPSGRVYAVCTTDVACEWWSQIKVFYSDDNGLTWNDSETLVDNTKLGTESHNTPGHTFVELVPLELADGSVYLFGRTNLGYIGYLKSEDGGKTFDTNNTYCTPFLSTEMCYSIEVDPYNPQHVYAVFGYDNDNVNGKGQYPRTRWVFARSTDSMKTWQILGTVHENIGTIGAMMNTNIHITENQVLANAFSYDDALNGGTWYGRTIAIQKDAQVGSNRFEQLHLRQASHAENTRTVYPFQSERVLLAHPESGAALLNNKRVEHVVFDNYIAMDVAAAFVSASVAAGEDGNLVFNTLGAEVTFPKEKVIAKEGVQYIDIDAFAKAYSMYVTDEHGTKIISPFESWSSLQRSTLRLSLDFFSKEL